MLEMPSHREPSKVQITESECIALFMRACDILGIFAGSADQTALVDDELEVEIDEENLERLRDRKTQRTKECKDFERERLVITEQLAHQTRDENQLAEIHIICERYRNRLHTATYEQQRELLLLFQVKARLAVEDGFKVAYVSCKLSAETVVVAKPSSNHHDARITQHLQRAVKGTSAAMEAERLEERLQRQDRVVRVQDARHAADVAAALVATNHSRASTCTWLIWHSTIRESIVARIQRPAAYSDATERVVEAVALVREVIA